MEFFYEEEALNQGKATPSPNGSTAQLTKDEKTNEAFNKFEDDIGDVYEKTAGKLKTLIRDNPSDELRLQIPMMDEATAAKAQEYLKTLDSNLANVENVATSYWNKVSTSSFWSNVTQNLSSTLDTAINLVADDGESSNGNTKNKPVIGGSRTETELRKLSNDKAIYLEYKDTDLKTIDINGKTDEISALLKNDNDLETLMNNIVPEHIAYDKFWSIYFTEKDKVLAEEDKRSKILASSKMTDKDSSKEDDEEEVGWGDDDDEDDEVGSSVVIVKKEDVENNSTDAEKVTKKSGEEEDDEEDDWE